MFKKNIVIYGFFTLIASALSFTLTPFLSHYLAVEEFGYIALFMVAMQLMTILVGFSMNSIISRSYHTRSDLSELIGSSGVFSVAMTMPLSFILLLVYPVLIEVSSYSLNILLIALVTAFFASIASVLLAFLQMKEEAFKWGIVTLSGALVAVVCSVILVMYVSADHNSRLVGIALGQGVTLVAAYFFVRQNILFCTSSLAGHFKYFFQTGWPLFVGALCGWAMISIDRVFVDSMLGEKSTGIYFFAVSLTMPVSLFQTTFLRAWSPRAYRLLSESLLKRVMLEFIGAFILFLLAAVVFSLVAMYGFEYVIDEKYKDSLSLIPGVALALAVFGVQGLLSPYFLHYEKQQYLMVSLLVGVIVFVTLTFVLLPYLGLWGAIAGLLVGHFVIGILLISSVVSDCWAKLFNI